MGFTDVVKLTAPDFQSTVADATVLVSLIPLAIGDLVGAEVLVEVQEAWNSNVSGLSVGVSLTENYFIDNSGSITGMVPYEVSLATVGPYVATAATHLVALMTPDTGLTVTPTTGKMNIWFRISHRKDRNLQA